MSNVKSLYENLLKEIGFPVDPGRDYDYKIKGDELVCYVDISRHGSPTFVEQSRKKLPKEYVIAITSLLEIQTAINLIQVDKDLENYHCQRSRLETQLESINTSMVYAQRAFEDKFGGDDKCSE